MSCFSFSLLSYCNLRLIPNCGRAMSSCIPTAAAASVAATEATTSAAPYVGLWRGHSHVFSLSSNPKLPLLSQVRDNNGVMPTAAELFRRLHSKSNGLQQVLCSEKAKKTMDQGASRVNYIMQLQTGYHIGHAENTRSWHWNPRFEVSLSKVRHHLEIIKEESFKHQYEEDSDIKDWIGKGGGEK